MPAGWDFGLSFALRLDEETASIKPFIAFLEQLGRQLGIPRFVEVYDGSAFVDGGEERQEVIVEHGVARLVSPESRRSWADLPGTGDIHRDTLEALLGSPSLVLPDSPHEGQLAIPEALQNEDVGSHLSYISASEALRRLQRAVTSSSPSLFSGRDAKALHQHRIGARRIPAQLHRVREQVEADRVVRLSVTRRSTPRAVGPAHLSAGVSTTIGCSGRPTRRLFHSRGRRRLRARLLRRQSSRMDHTSSRPSEMVGSRGADDFVSRGPRVA